MRLFAAAESELVAAVITALGAVAGFLGWARRAITAKLNTLLEQSGKAVEQVAAIGERVAAVEEKVDSVGARVKRIEPIAETVQKEFSPNGGSSLRDAINRVERRAVMMDGILRARFEGDSAATYVCGPDGQCTYASSAIADLFGMTPDALLGNGWLRAIKGHGERIRVWHNWLQAVKEGVPYEDVYEITVEGKSLKVRTYTRVVPDDQGKPLCYFGLVTPAPDSKLFGKPAKPDATSPPPPPDCAGDDSGPHDPIAPKG